MKRAIRRFIMVIAVCLMGAVLLVVACTIWVRSSTKAAVYRDVNRIPSNNVGLVLGSSKYMSGHRSNPHFQNRVEAAAQLYKANKVRHLIVSGDNYIKEYDEPTDMKAALLELGIPEQAITADYAGFRTLDSVVRAKEVFGQTGFTIISDEFHTYRALFISRYYRIDAIAFAARDTSLRYSIRSKTREYLACVKAVLDLYMLKTKPKFLGEKVAIPLSDSSP